MKSYVYPPVSELDVNGPPVAPSESHQLQWRQRLPKGTGFGERPPRSSNGTDPELNKPGRVDAVEIDDGLEFFGINPDNRPAPEAPLAFCCWAMNGDMPREFSAADDGIVAEVGRGRTMRRVTVGSTSSVTVSTTESAGRGASLGGDA